MSTFKNIPLNKRDKLHGALAFWLWIVIWVIYNMLIVIDHHTLNGYIAYDESYYFFTEINGLGMIWLSVIIGLPLYSVMKSVRYVKIGDNWSAFVWIFVSGAIAMVVWHFSPTMPMSDYSEISRELVARRTTFDFVPLYSLTPFYLLICMAVFYPLFIKSAFAKECYNKAAMYIIPAVFLSIIMFWFDFYSDRALPLFFGIFWLFWLFTQPVLWWYFLGKVSKMKTETQVNLEKSQAYWDKIYTRNLNLHNNCEVKALRSTELECGARPIEGGAVKPRYTVKVGS